MFMRCSTLVIRPESNGDNALPSILCIVESTLSSTNDAGEPTRSPALLSARFKKRSIYELRLTFQSKYSVIKKSSIVFPGDYATMRRCLTDESELPGSNRRRRLAPFPRRDLVMRQCRPHRTENAVASDQRVE